MLDSSPIFTQSLIEKPLITALALAFTAFTPTVHATETDSNSIVAPQTVVVTATRTEKALEDATASIVVIGEQQLATEAPATLFDALDGIPNVSVEASNSPIYGKVSIRGGDPNQNIYLIDGVRQDNYTMSGNHPVGIFLDPELIKQLEVKRGGGSVLYGNGGIAGVIAATTKSASDFLALGESFGAMLKTGYDSASHEWSKMAYLYGRTDTIDALFAITHRGSGDLKLSVPTSSTDRDAQESGLLAKVSFAPTLESMATLTYNYDDADDGWTADGLPLGYDYKQHRITGAYQYENGPLVNLKTSIQWSRSEYDYQTAYNNPRFGEGTIRNGDKFNSLGLTLQNTSSFTLGVPQEVTAGFDIYRSSQTSYSSNPMLNDGSTASSEDSQRPNADALDLGIFVTDALALTDKITLTPGVRFNYYRRSADNPKLASSSDHEVTPSLALEFKPMEGLTLWGTASLGYRPPSMDELFYNLPLFKMGGMAFPMHGTVLANPDLKPEKSRNYELGVNANFGSLLTETDRLTVRAALFYNDFRDGFHINEWKDDMGMQVYQVVNLNHVVRKGIELSANYKVGNAAFDVGYGYLRATDKETGEREEGISPQNFSFRASYQIPAASLGAWYRFNWSEKAPTDSMSSYYKDVSTHALGLSWAPRVANFCDFTLNASVENLTDEKYLRSVSYRMGGTTGFGRTVRVWVSAKF